MNTNINDIDNYIILVTKAKEKENLDLALDYYSKLLELLLNLYKSEPSSTISQEQSLRKVELLSSLEYYMSEAEVIKQTILERKLIFETQSSQIIDVKNIKKDNPHIQKDADIKDESSSSIFSFFTSRTTKPIDNHNQTINKLTSTQTDNKTVPDFHDYNAEMRKKKADIINTTKTLVTNNPSSSSSNIIATKPTKLGRSNIKSTTTPSTSIPNININNSNSSNNILTTSSNNHRPNNPYELQILDEMLDESPGIYWSDIAGLQYAKQTLQEAVILPNLRPDLFTGLRSPPKGVLLFGPPGTGKTMLAKAVASESDFCFFSISSSSVTSKYIGDGEKLMKALFELARAKQPSVIFFDEIDAIMSSRKENEHEASRRLKTEFMTQVDGTATAAGDRLLVMAATNIPWEIDEAVLRRLVRRIYIPLPDKQSRRSLIEHLLAKQANVNNTPTCFSVTASSKKAAAALKPLLTITEIDHIVTLTEGYSGSDLTALCQEAALGPIRELLPSALRTIKVDEVRSLNEQDFLHAIRNIRPSVSSDNLNAFQKWAGQYGATNNGNNR